MKTNIKLFLIAALAMMSVHGWGADETTYPAGIYYFEFIGFNSTSDQKVFGFNMFNNLTNYHSQSGDVVQLYSEGTCNANVNRNSFNYFSNKTSGVPMDVVAIDLSSPVSIQSDNACLKLGVGASSATAWGTFNWKKYSDVGTPEALSTGVYYLKITRTGASSYSVAWQTSGSLPACAATDHTLTFNSSDDDKGSVTGTVAGDAESSPVSSVAEGAEIVLTATPSSSAYLFTCWKVGDDIVSYDNPYTFDMPDADITVTAEFEDNRKSSGGCGNCFTVE